VFQNNIGPFQVSETAQSVDKSREIATFFRGAASMPKHANPRDFSAVFCAHRKRPRDRRATHELDEFASSHSPLGDIISDSNDIYGDGVNVAARLEALADPGGIMVSRNVHDQVRDKLSFGFEDMGEQSVKNISRPIGVHRVSLAEGVPSGTVKSPSMTSKTELSSANRPSIAVLPFDNMSGDSEQEYFADGICEDIITALSKLRWFFVIARNSSFTYKRKTVDVKTVARELAVRYVLEGGVRKAGNRVRITAQLIDAMTGNHIWADRYDGNLTDVFDLQDEITTKVVSAIEPRLLKAEGLRSQQRSADDLGAWDMVIQANFLFWQVSKPDGERAIAILKQAVERFPRYAPAHSMLAFVLLMSGQIHADHEGRHNMLNGN
jgi:adenylate cyclase